MNLQGEPMASMATFPCEFPGCTNVTDKSNWCDYHQKAHGIKITNSIIEGTRGGMWGVIVTKDFLKGHLKLPYEGIFYTADEAKEVEEANKGNYLYRINNDNKSIDAKHKNSCVARFINFGGAETANCKAGVTEKTIEGEKDYEIFIENKKDLKKGEELFLNYGPTKEYFSEDDLKKFDVITPPILCKNEKEILPGEATTQAGNKLIALIKRETGIKTSIKDLTDKLCERTYTRTAPPEKAGENKYAHTTADDLVNTFKRKGENYVMFAHDTNKITGYLGLERHTWESEDGKKRMDRFYLSTVCVLPGPKKKQALRSLGTIMIKSAINFARNHDGNKIDDICLHAMGMTGKDIDGNLLVSESDSEILKNKNRLIYKEKFGFLDCENACTEDPTEGGVWTEEEPYEFFGRGYFEMSKPLNCKKNKEKAKNTPPPKLSLPADHAQAWVPIKSKLVGRDKQGKRLTATLFKKYDTDTEKDIYGWSHLGHKQTDQLRRVTLQPTPDKDGILEEKEKLAEAARNRQRDSRAKKGTPRSYKKAGDKDDQKYSSRKGSKKKGKEKEKKPKKRGEDKKDQTKKRRKGDDDDDGAGAGAGAPGSRKRKPTKSPARAGRLPRRQDVGPGQQYEDDEGLVRRRAAPARKRDDSNSDTDYDPVSDHDGGDTIGGGKRKASGKTAKKDIKKTSTKDGKTQTASKKKRKLMYDEDDFEGIMSLKEGNPLITRKGSYAEYLKDPNNPKYSVGLPDRVRDDDGINYVTPEEFEEMNRDPDFVYFEGEEDWKGFLEEDSEIPDEHRYKTGILDFLKREKTEKEKQQKVAKLLDPSSIKRKSKQRRSRNSRRRTKKRRKF